MTSRPDLDTHHVTHDLLSLGFALVFGAIGTVALQSVELGLLMLGATFTLGILTLRFTPARRAVNRLVPAPSAK